MAQRYPVPPSRLDVVPVDDDDDTRDVIIKVKYRGALKRFNACVNGSHFDHNIATLRSKIANAFKFRPDDQFVLTYIDEDEDVVMLDDDDDLRDAAVKQNLDPLRIDVQLKSNSSGGPQAKHQSSNSRSPVSTGLEDQLAQVKSAIDEALKFVPEQVPAVLAKLSHDLRSKAASSAPSLADLLDRMAKLMAPKSGMQRTSGLAGSSSGSSSAGPQAPMNLKFNHESELATASASQSSDMQDHKSSKARGLKSVLVEETKAQVEQAPEAGSGGKLFDRKKRTDTQTKAKYHAQSRGKSVISSSVPPVPTIAHGVPILGSCTDYKLNGNMAFGSDGKINGSVFHPPRGSPYCTMPSNFSIGSNGKINGDSDFQFPVPRVTRYCPAATRSNGKTNSGLQTAFPQPAYDYNKLAYDSSPLNLYMPSSVGPYGSYQNADSFGGSYSDPSNKYGSMPHHPIHRWVECDGCGAAPIVGPCYKSNVKDDYDLCSLCFSLMGKEAEYTRMDKPTAVVSERLKDIDKSYRLPLDCHFIKDLTVPDGTLMAPSTPFRKIWRMRNSGSTMWPFGTQLTWTGGDKFAHQSAVQLGVSVNGFPVDGEIDVCVDFFAPTKPGRYISYWRLASRDLQKFGQQIWVLIQVEQPIQTIGNKQSSAINLNLPTEGNTTTSKPIIVEQPVQTSSNKQTAAINLNLSAEGSTTKWEPSIDMNVKPTDFAYEYPNSNPDDVVDLDDFLEKRNRAHKPKESEVVGSVMPCAPTAVEPVQVPITDPHTSSTGALGMPADVSASEAAPLPNPISVAIPAPTVVNSHVAPVSVPLAPLPDGITNNMEEKLLRELEAMGFRQADLNKEVLRQNQYDLLKSVDDLCGFNEWDPLLAELKELI